MDDDGGGDSDYGSRKSRKSRGPKHTPSSTPQSQDNSGLLIL